MKTKQLANILIKILGLSVLVHSIPSIISGLVQILQVRSMSSQIDFYWIYPFSAVLQIALGIYLVLKSRDVAACLFKNEDE